MEVKAEAAYSVLIEFEEHFLYDLARVSAATITNTTGN